MGEKSASVHHGNYQYDPSWCRSPNLLHTNTLNENAMDIQERDRHDVVLANPPFGGGERREVQQNFPIPSGGDRTLRSIL